MNPKYEAELKKLTPRQKAIVISGLENKLSHYYKSHHLSYRYDVCPVCIDMGSTEESPKCESCYIKESCKAPFSEGFRNNNIRGAAYFQKMLTFLQSLPSPLTLVVGGAWDSCGGKPSGIARKLADTLQADILNGGNTNDLPNKLLNYNLIIWMPDIPNEEPKNYPQKDNGAILICSKVMRPSYHRAEAVARIFAMHGNAVIEIRKQDNGFIHFTLTDALCNTWSEGESIEALSKDIGHFYDWTTSSIRVKSVRLDTRTKDLPRLLEITRSIAQKVENSLGARYFGNVSTRCQSLFPGIRMGTAAVVSPRNLDKRGIYPEDMIYVVMEAMGKDISYIGDRKPSVDAPVQLTLFSKFPRIRFFIHGHAKVKDAPPTKKYYPCGDLREVPEIERILDRSPYQKAGAINLMNHGFLLYAENIEDLQILSSSLEFESPQ